MLVTKRDGTKQPFSIEKLRKVINWACAGLNVNPLELESSINSSMKSGITTNNIQQILIDLTTRLASVEQPDWIIVGGRLVLYNLEREVYKNYGFSYDESKKTFYEYLQYMVKNGYYKKEVLSYSKEEIDELASCINPEADLKYTIGGALSLRKKYLLKRGKKVLELPQYADMVSAMLISLPESNNRLWHVKNNYDLISKRIVSLATPLKANLRSPNGSTSSCFILEIDDSLESLMDSYKKMAYISKAGGGIGVYISKLRPSKSMLLGQPVANNINLWVKIINDIAVAVNQAGVRKGAITPAVDIWHKDVEDFIEIKTEVGELRLKSFDIYPQVVLNNVFLERKKNNQHWWLVDNHECIDVLGIDLTETPPSKFREAYIKVEQAYESGKLKNGRMVSASELWKRMLTVYIETGDLYLANRDTMNAHNPLVDHGYIIKCANLCTESYSPIKASSNYRLIENADGSSGEICDTGYAHTCDLASINHAEILNDDKLLERAVTAAVRMLDNAMMITTTPIPEANKHNKLFGTIGLGTVGTADWMAYNKLSYNREEDHEKLEALFERMAFIAFNTSADLAEERGSFELFDESTFPKGILLGKTAEELLANSKAKLPWDSLVTKTSRGISNMLTFSPAPNTSTSVLMGASASYLPVFSKFNYETMSNLAVPVIPKFIEKHFWHYNEAFTVPTEKIIRLTTRLQKWVDTGMSMELIINPDITDIKKISDALLEGFNNGLKTVYYSRTIDTKREGGCTSCAN